MNYITAAEAWERLCVIVTDERLTSPDWRGRFWGIKGMMFFACGEGCCDDLWEDKAEFLRFHAETKFEICVNE